MRLELTSRSLPVRTRNADLQRGNCVVKKLNPLAFLAFPVLTSSKMPLNRLVLVTSLDLTGVFCTSESEREFTLEGSWYADEEIQAGADCDAVTAG